jgi:BlaI family penicillinase repressor
LTIKLQAKMTRPKSTYPTDLELQILKLLWERSPLAVREIRELLANSGRVLAHTSVITTLNVMAGKQYLTRSMQGKSCLFAPSVTRESVADGMLGDVVKRVFDGSAKAVMLSLFESSDIHPDELKDLKEILDRKTKECSE